VFWWMEGCPKRTMLRMCPTLLQTGLVGPHDVTVMAERIANAFLTMRGDIFPGSLLILGLEGEQTGFMCLTTPCTVSALTGCANLQGVHSLVAIWMWTQYKCLAALPSLRRMTPTSQISSSALWKSTETLFYLVLGMWYHMTPGCLSCQAAACKEQTRLCRM
jgi:hypothetical protein